MNRRKCSKVAGEIAVMCRVVEGVWVEDVRGKVDTHVKLHGILKGWKPPREKVDVAGGPSSLVSER